MPEQAVQLKMKAEGVNPSLITNPNAPAPPPDENSPGGDDDDSNDSD